MCYCLDLNPVTAWLNGPCFALPNHHSTTAQLPTSSSHFRLPVVPSRHTSTVSIVAAQSASHHFTRRRSRAAPFSCLELGRYQLHYDSVRMVLGPELTTVPD